MIFITAPIIWTEMRRKNTQQRKKYVFYKNTLENEKKNPDTKTSFVLKKKKIYNNNFPLNINFVFILIVF